MIPSQYYINAFNPEWLDAWGGNVDSQPCLDYFAVITYITDYLTKDDTGVTAILREVIKKQGKGRYQRTNADVDKYIPDP